jgi:hypothetical protein
MPELIAEPMPALVYLQSDKTEKNIVGVAVPTGVNVIINNFGDFHTF